ncbi:multidrug ABC transporter ATP-binding and permease protein [Ligilactobacillus salitolerans]|uniref:Multidrug ABC transporter ATP-binding and permease protein n=2 Tax=Ligilactobacillus salitolerans TaxID=1808352 RepID=A0A401ISF8_9LACO|nr:multidrug ABC transporter ATP-binding and permease protein [Ligilactobacillus salitolerans]
MTKYFWRYPWRLAFTVVANITAAGVLVAYSYVLQLITDIATGAIQLSFALAVPAVIVYLIVQALTDSTAEYLNESVPARIGQELRGELFTHYNQFRPLHFYQKQVGQYVAQLTKQVDVVTQSYFHVILRVVYLVSLLILAVLGTFLIDPVITVGVALLSLPAVIFPFLVKKWLESAKTDLVIAIENYTSKVADILAGFTTIQYALSVPQFKRKHERASKQVLLKTVRDQRIQKITSGVSDFLGDVMYLGAWLMGAYFVRRGEITLGQLVAFSQLASLFNWPMAMLTEMLAEFYGGRKQARELAMILKTTTDGPLFLPEQTNFSISLNNDPLIEFQNVSYQVDDKQILQSIDLQFAADKKYLVVGASGSGKTTLIRTLLGDLAPTAGTVKLQGKPMIEFDRGAVYSNFGVMTQKPDIFQGTVRENVTLFDQSFSADAVKKAIYRAGLGSWLIQHGLDTQISAESPLLSGGEKQRLVLARLFLHDPPFMIFDELTTGLDPQIAAKLQMDLLSMRQGFILITHQYNAATFAQVDEIIVLQEGQVMARGNAGDVEVSEALTDLQLI